MAIQFIPPVKCLHQATIIIDHDLGGGTTFFRNQLVEQLKETQPVLLVLSKDRIKSSSIDIVIFHENSVSQSCDHNADEVFAFLKQTNSNQIVINSLVSFRPFIQFIKKLLTFVEMIKPEYFSIAFHDYYPICPSYNLLDFDWKYCGVPDESVCIKCRQKHFSGMLQDREIENWRKCWALLLRMATDVVTFSHSSKEIVLRGFPEIEQKVRVQPHSMEYFSPQNIANLKGVRTNIGIIGKITKAKGSEKIIDLDRFISENSLDATITIFGELITDKALLNVNVLGKFEIKSLPTLIEKEKISLFFMPSICPETFSYVTHELISMNLPVVSFDLGAQAETLKAYKYGKVVSINVDPGKLFEVLSQPII